MTTTTEKLCSVSSDIISREQFKKHEKVLRFHAGFNGPHTLTIFIDEHLVQYISIDDAALDAMIQKREEMRALFSLSER